jgi:glycine/D-amino acid oxidase-like deaminating enzyme
MFTGAKLPIKGALYTAADGRAEPQKAAPAIAEAARDRGAHVMTECAVRGIETAAGKVCGVVTERGYIKCQAVVLAGGAWSNLFLGNNGISLPPIKSYEFSLTDQACGRRSRTGNMVTPFCAA